MSDTLPASFTDEAALEAFMARPSPRLIAELGALEGDLVILGIAGKMGVTLGMLAVNALRAAGSRRRVIGVSRFSDVAARCRLEEAGVTTLAADLLDDNAVRDLPDAGAVVYLAGRKFGTSAGGEALTWAMNAVAPALVARRYAGRAPVVALSTGCVYPQVAADSGGCDETIPPQPVGEYAMSALARERIFEHSSREAGLELCLIRLNYALDLRYGVIHDLGRSLLADEPIDLGTACFNGIWQGDANRMILHALACCTAPGTVLNLTGPETLSVATVARRLGRVLGREPRFAGSPGGTQWLSDGSLALGRFGYGEVPVDRVIDWTARWLAQGGASLGKPTHYAAQDGKF